MNFLNILGMVAGTLCTISFLPQLVKIWKSKSAKDISMGMFIIFSIGISLWILYGFFIKSFPIVVANLATLLLAFIIIIMKVKYK